ncbi:hypothetical protein NDR87_26160 [Nocardia sp. CDC159]|uniref:Uncharacterized protein n=1 Tax=Nocardia pulmonis TaxID=2951408 RepID=A0A9X2EAS3_9NOCA|nr:MULTISPECIES: hypothetical protein [Nocardia]MCM6774931.1 hypothetical protein [Nocardia pulmonis]MCM6789862.1 hypothetical protein [Nocardia sp. CDC159]
MTRWISLFGAVAVSVLAAWFAALFATAARDLRDETQVIAARARRAQLTREDL